ncbi:hypothetical protein HZH68_003834 [Vespula germanica]|uniref:Uncharacterized protein n=2 Tax=Vespula TaxID=7451 RepID=A0A834KMI8_VESGE|nr:hypothetical protein HZH68_003834 [Vespula germanica]KAF7431351.1 hypothetical protein H0235_004275 [Vespula pensylvanica]
MVIPVGFEGWKKNVDSEDDERNHLSKKSRASFELSNPKKCAVDLKVRVWCGSEEGKIGLMQRRRSSFGFPGVGECTNLISHPRRWNNVVT